MASNKYTGFWSCGQVQDSGETRLTLLVGGNLGRGGRQPFFVWATGYFISLINLSMGLESNRRSDS